MITSPKVAATPTAPSGSPRSASTTIAPQPANTSANVANASTAQRRPSELVNELGDECSHARVDLVANAPDGCDVLTRGVVHRPVLVALARIDRTGVAAAHGDDDVDALHGVVGEDLRGRARQVDADLVHRLHDRGVDVIGRGAARGMNGDPAC